MIKTAGMTQSLLLSDNNRHNEFFPLAAAKRRLLITDPYTPQSYDIVLALRSKCETIVVTVSGQGRFKRIFNHTANSKYISKMYYLKNARKSSIHQLHNRSKQPVASSETGYLEEIFDICQKERIDLIYPSCDEEVLFFARHAALFKERNIEVPVNSYQLLTKLQDKYMVIQLASASGIPCPQTQLTEDYFKEIKSERITFPLIIKPRFGSTAFNVEIIRNEYGVKKWKLTHADKKTQYVIQEFIPGDKIIYYRVYMKRNGELLHTSCALCKRPEMIMFQSRGLLIQPEPIPPVARRINAFLQSQGYAGYAHAQLKVDSRDGMPKLMEINTRISRGTWTETRLGFNAPLVSLSLITDDSVCRPQLSNDADMMFVWPVQDALIFLGALLFGMINTIAKLFPLGSAAQERATPALRTLALHFKRIYVTTRKRKIADNYFSHFLRDPLVSIAYWISFWHYVVGEFKSRYTQKA